MHTKAKRGALPQSGGILKGLTRQPLKPPAGAGPGSLPKRNRYRLRSTASHPRLPTEQKPLPIKEYNLPKNLPASYRKETANSQGVQPPINGIIYRPVRANTPIPPKRFLCLEPAISPYVLTRSRMRNRCPPCIRRRITFSPICRPLRTVTVLRPITA